MFKSKPQTQLSGNLLIIIRNTGNHPLHIFMPALAPTGTATKDSSKIQLSGINYIRPGLETKKKKKRRKKEIN